MKKRIGYEKSYIRLLYNLKYTDRNKMIRENPLDF